MAILILYVHYGNQIINLAHVANRRVSIESSKRSSHHTPDLELHAFLDLDRPIFRVGRQQHRLAPKDHGCAAFLGFRAHQLGAFRMKGKNASN